MHPNSLFIGLIGTLGPKYILFGSMDPEGAAKLIQEKQWPSPIPQTRKPRSPKRGSEISKSESETPQAP